jgi:hypothetical protein
MERMERLEKMHDLDRLSEGGRMDSHHTKERAGGSFLRKRDRLKDLIEGRGGDPA